MGPKSQPGVLPYLEAGCFAASGCVSQGCHVPWRLELGGHGFLVLDQVLGLGLKQRVVKGHPEGHSPGVLEQHV